MAPTLKDYDREAYTGRQPVSKAALALLQRKAVEGDPESAAYLRKYMISLGIFIAREEARENGIEEDDLLRHLPARRLEMAGYQTSFSVFSETVHTDIVRGYIRDVIGRTWTSTPDGRMIRTEQYKKAVRAMNPDGGGRIILHPVVGDVPDEIVAAVWENERRIEREKMIRKARFRRLKETVRDGSLPYLTKLNLLINLTNAGEKARTFFCVLYGTDDGRVRTTEETASRLGMDAESAERLVTRMLGYKRSRFFHTFVSEDVELMVTLDHFLCKNGKNRKERDRIRKELGYKGTAGSYIRIGYPA